MVIIALMALFGAGPAGTFEVIQDGKPSGSLEVSADEKSVVLSIAARKGSEIVLRKM
jgi:hypothetical protein